MEEQSYLCALGAFLYLLGDNYPVTISQYRGEKTIKFADDWIHLGNSLKSNIKFMDEDIEKKHMAKVILPIGPYTTDCDLPTRISFNDVLRRFPRFLVTDLNHKDELLKKRLKLVGKIIYDSPNQIYRDSLRWMSFISLKDSEEALPNRNNLRILFSLNYNEKKRDINRTPTHRHHL